MKKKKFYLKTLKICALSIFSCAIFLSSQAFAARLYFEPQEGQFNPGETFTVDVKIDTEGECINAVQGDIKVSSSPLTIVDFINGESILTLWLKTPQIDQKAGTISFTAGIPGEYCGRVAGDPGPSDLLGKIIFRIPGNIVGESKENSARIEFANTSQVVLSDGKGTFSELSFGVADLKISSQPGATNNTLKELLEKDNIPPEPFSIEIQQDSLVFDGKYFLVFLTTDKQTGVDYFEVKEGQGSWEKASSPYLLKNQEIDSHIIVRAVDKAGNERIVEYMPLKEIKPFPYKIYIAGAIVLVLVLLGIFVILRRKKHTSEIK